MTTIYLDIVLLENLVMNAILLIATGIWLKKKCNRKRIFFASLLGASFAIISYCISFANIFGLALKIVLSILMVKIAYKPSQKTELLYQVLLFYLVSFLFGGCALMASYIFQTEETVFKNGVWQIKTSLFSIIISGIIGLAVWNFVVRITQKKEQKRIYTLVLTFQGKKKKVSALFDTGNELKEPISKEPVIVLEEEIFEQLTGNSLKSILEKFSKGEEKDFSSIYAIPFQSVGKKKGIMYAIRMEEIIILETEQKQENVLIGIYEGCFSKKREYQALIGPDLLEGSRKKDGFTTNFKKSNELFVCEIFKRRK